MEENRKEVELSIGVDFGMDLVHGWYDRKRLKALFSQYQSWGVTRLNWIYSNVIPGDPKLWHPYQPVMLHAAKTYARMGDFFPAAISVAHELGMELHMFFQPFDRGGHFTYPKGSRLARKWGKFECLEGVIARAGQALVKLEKYRMERNMLGIPKDLGSRVISRLELSSDEPTKARKFSMTQLEISVSDDNSTYRRYRGPYTLRVKKVGSGVRWMIDGLDIREKFVALRWSGLKKRDAFGNRLDRLIRVYDDRGERLPITLGLVSWKDRYDKMDERISEILGTERVVNREANKTGYVVGHPLGGTLDHYMSSTRFSLGRDQPYLAFARGLEQKALNLSPSYKRVRDFWLGEIKRYLVAGADGIELRIQNHDRSMDWESYGFEPPVVETYRKKYGVDIRREKFDQKKHLEVRAEGFTQFVREASQLVRKANRPFNLRLGGIMGIKDGERYQGMFWDCKRWLREKLLDGVTVGPLFDSEQRKVIRMANKLAGSKLSIACSTNFNSLPLVPHWPKILKDVVEFGRKYGAQSIELYESSAISKVDSRGRAVVLIPKLPGVLRKLKFKSQ